MFRSIFTSLALVMSGGAVAQTPSWTYGEHPAWGLSASITIGDESVGLKCLPNRGLAAAAVAVNYTRGLVGRRKNASTSDAVVTTKFIGARGEGSGFLSMNPAGYYEELGNTCEVDLDSFRQGRLLLLFDSTVDVMKLGANAEKHPKVIARIPLHGAKAAIDKLIKACPAMRRDIANQCGV
jgi:hypothetical protein